MKFDGSIRTQTHVAFPVLGRGSWRKELVFTEPQGCLGYGKEDAGSVTLLFASEDAETHLMFPALKRSLVLLKTEAAMKDDNLFRGTLNRTLALITSRARQRPRR